MDDESRKSKRSGKAGVEMKIKGLAQLKRCLERNPMDYEKIGFLGINPNVRVPPTRSHIHSEISYFFFRMRGTGYFT